MPSTNVDKLDFCKLCAVKWKASPSTRDVPCWGCGTSCGSTTSAAPAETPQTPVYPVEMQPMPYRPRYFSHTYVNHQPYHAYSYAYPIHPAYYVYPPPPIPVIYTPPPPPPPPPPVRYQPTLKPGPIVPLVEKPPATTPVPNPVAYQTLQLLLEDLNHLLYTPHEEQPFYFRGTCAIIADPAEGHVKKLVIVAQQIVERTALSFNPHTLEVQSSEDSASASTSTLAVWMDCRRRPTSRDVSCTHCRHTLYIVVERCHGPLIRGRDTNGYQGQQIGVDLRHSVE